MKKNIVQTASQYNGDVVSLLIYEFDFGIYSSCRAKPE